VIGPANAACLAAPIAIAPVTPVAPNASVVPEALAFALALP
jgi:hypothetical protein